MAKKVKIKDIARKLGISSSTVSLAFNNPKLVNRKTRDKILELSYELGYIRKRYKKGSNNVIGIMTENFYTNIGNFYNFVLMGILKRAKKLGLDTIITTFEKSDDCLPSVISRKYVDGLIILGKIERSHVLQVKQENMPVVLCGNPIPGMELHTVIPDGRHGTYEATKHLIELGHKQISIITGGPMFDPVVSDRLDGFLFALNEAKLKVHDNYIIEGIFDNLQTVYKASEKLFEQKNMPSAVVCMCDAFAYVLIRILKEKGLKIPQDISIIGFDDIPIPEYLGLKESTLTTVHVNLEELGSNSVDVLCEVIENPKKATYRITIPTKLIIRKTSARIK